MEAGHIALIIIGAISCTEAAWGLTAPTRLQAAVRTLVDEMPDRNILTGITFVLLAVTLLIVMTAEQRLSDWALLVISWIFFGGAYVNFKPGAFQALARVLILDRSPAGLRLMYGLEMALALGLVVLGLFRL